jgi:acyl-CoA thioesterase-1
MLVLISLRFRYLQALVVALAVLFLALGCGAHSPVEPGSPEAAAPSASGPQAVIVLGDSLMAGPGLQPSETVPALLQARARAAGYRYDVINDAVSGMTSSEALPHLDRWLVPEARVAIVALGANDGLRGDPVATLKRNLETIIERAESRGLRVLLCGMEMPPTRGLDYSIAFHNVFPDLAARYDVPLMPFLLLGVAGIPKYNQDDGVHPNAAGARIIADNMWPYLEPLLR